MHFKLVHNNLTKTKNSPCIKLNYTYSHYIFHLLNTADQQKSCSGVFVHEPFMLECLKQVFFNSFGGDKCSPFADPR